MSTDNNSRLQKTIEHYRRVREYRKEKLDNISRQLEMFVYSLRKSKICKRESTDKCKYQKELWNMDQLENVEEKSPRRASSLTYKA